MQPADYYKIRNNYRMGGLRKEHILALIPAGVKTILDVGCGSGEFAKGLSEQGLEVTGVDISPSALEEAKPFLADPYCFDITGQWPEELLKRRFDLVIASEVIEHVFAPDDVIENLKRVATSHLIITTPNFLFWKNRLKMLCGIFRYEDKGIWDFGHIRFFTLKTFRDLLNQHGLHVEQEHHTYPNLEFRNLDFLGKLVPGLFAYQFITLVKKHAD
jgi:methionine biosynthesis protein MetW